MKKYLLLPMLLGLFILIAQPAFSFCGCCHQLSACPCSPCCGPCITGCAVPVVPAPQLVYQPRVISQTGVACCPKLSYCAKTCIEPVITYRSKTVLEPVMTCEAMPFCQNKVVYEPQLVCPTCCCPTPCCSCCPAPCYSCCPTHIMGGAAPLCCPKRSFWDRVF